MQTADHISLKKKWFIPLILGSLDLQGNVVGINEFINRPRHLRASLGRTGPPEDQWVLAVALQ